MMKHLLVKEKMMKHKVQVTFTQDEYDHLLALKNYFGFKSLSETVSFAVEKSKCMKGTKSIIII